MWDIYVWRYSKEHTMLGIYTYAYSHAVYMECTYIHTEYIYLLMKWQCKWLQEKSHCLECILLHIRDPYIYFKMNPKKKWSIYVEIWNAYMHDMTWDESGKRCSRLKKRSGDSKKDIDDSEKDALLGRRQQSGRRDLALRAACRWLTCHSCRKACPLVFTCLYISVHIYIYILIQQS